MKTLYILGLSFQTGHRNVCNDEKANSGTEWAQLNRTHYAEFGQGVDAPEMSSDGLRIQTPHTLTNTCCIQVLVGAASPGWFSLHNFVSYLVCLLILKLNECLSVCWGLCIHSVLDFISPHSVSWEGGYKRENEKRNRASRKKRMFISDSYLLESCVTMLNVKLVLLAMLILFCSRLRWITSVSQS